MGHPSASHSPTLTDTLFGLCQFCSCVRCASLLASILEVILEHNFRNHMDGNFTKKINDKILHCTNVFIYLGSSGKILGEFSLFSQVSQLANARDV